MTAFADHTERGSHHRGQNTALAAAAVTILVTTPLAFLTVRRWWHWWNS